MIEESKEARSEADIEEELACRFHRPMAIMKQALDEFDRVMSDQAAPFKRNVTPDEALYKELEAHSLKFEDSTQSYRCTRCKSVVGSDDSWRWEGVATGWTHRCKDQTPHLGHYTPDIEENS